MTKENTKGNWFKIHRELFDNKLWLSEPFTRAQAWIDLVGNANHKDGSFFVRGIEVKIERGQIGWSEITMAKRWKWSRDKVRRFLMYLENESQIIQQKVYKVTSITTIINYDKYQDNTTNDTTEKQQKNNRQDTNKKVKKEKNIIADKSATSKALKTKEDTMWKNYEEPTIDADSGEYVPSEQETKMERAKRLHKKSLEIMKGIEDKYRVQFTKDARLRNSQAKVISDLMGNPDKPKILPSEIIRKYGEMLDDKFWVGKDKKPTLYTLRSRLAGEVK